MIVEGVLWGALTTIIATVAFFIGKRSANLRNNKTQSDLIDFIVDSVDRLPDGVARFGADEKLIYCNSTYRDMNKVIADLCVPGMPFEELARGKVTRDWQGSEGLSQEEYIAERVAIFRGGQREWEEQYDDGTWILARDHPTDDGGRVCLRLDITERKKAELQLHHMANHDPLTNLPGLRLAQATLENTMKLSKRHQRSFSLMFLDLDGFKAVNDNLGHEKGDEALRQVATRILACVRDSDLAARIGGDEFLVILNEVQNKEDAATIAEKIINALSRPLELGGEIAKIGVSIGIALYPEHGTTVDNIIKAADNSMYQVKAQGKNAYRFVGTAAN